MRAPHQISLLSQPCLLLYQHSSSSWQLYWTVKSNNTTEECFCHSWESTLILLVGHRWLSAKSIQCFYFGAASRHKTFYKGQKAAARFSKAGRLLNIPENTLQHAQIKQTFTDWFFCEKYCRVQNFAADQKYRWWSHVTSYDVFVLGKRLSAVIKCL